MKLFRLSHWSIVTKLIMVNLLILIAVGGMVSVTLVSSNRLNTLFLRLVNEDVTQLITNAELGRTLSQVFADTHLLLNTFTEQEDAVSTEGERLLHILHDTMQTSYSDSLDHALLLLSNTFKGLLEQSTRVMTILQEIRKIDTLSHTTIEELDARVAELLMNFMLDGKEEEVFSLEQVSNSLPNYKNILFQVSSLISSSKQAHLYIQPTTEDYTQQILKLLGKLQQDLTVIDMATENVARFNTTLKEQLTDYHASVNALDEAMLEFQEHLREFTTAQEQAVELMKGIDAKSSETSKTVQANVLQATRLSQNTVITLSLVLLGVMFVTGVYVVRMVRPLKHLAKTAELLAAGDLNVDVHVIRNNDEIGVLLKAFRSMKDTIGQVIAEVNLLTQSVRSGELDVRGNVAPFGGSWYELVVGLNTIIDEFVSPFTQTAEALDRLAKGDVPSKVTEEYQGDFNAIKNNLNRLIDVTEELTHIAQEIAQGNVQIRVEPRSDEDRLMHAFTRTIEYIQDVADVAQQIAVGKIQVSVTPRSPDDILNQAFAHTIQYIQDVMHAAEEMAQGNLTIEVEKRSEQDNLMHSLNIMIHRIQAIVRDVQSSARGLASGSQELSKCAENLSQGVSQQAAATEEVSSSMEQMTANIRQNTDNALQTKKIALQAAEFAEETGKVVAGTLVAMQQIAEKIMIIQDIASQTRVLSLNATIEAARAHDHGKAFSVVAAEVRKLSNTTSTAADEINRLAISSLTISRKASEMLGKLEPSIHHTAELVQEIAAANTEQSIGAEHINTALQQLDQVTQQHAAMTEELGSMAEGLAAQSRGLQDSIAFFRVFESTEYRQN